MKEVKFRGLYECEDGTKEWEYGYLGKCDYKFIIEDDQGLGTFIDENSIGQYTGLKDKNGVKIYEGDIVSAWSEGICAKGVVTKRVDGLWIIKPSWQNNKLWGICPNKKGFSEVEVIGNIYENPELLENNRE